MKIITLYTRSHEVLFDWFAESLSRNCPSLKLIAFETTQHSLTGNYASPGFQRTMSDKLDILLSCWNDISDQEFFLYSDCDVQFFGDVAIDFNCYRNLSADIYFQDDVCRYCAGFMFVRKCPATKEFFEIAKSQTTGHPEVDQGAMNDLILAGKSPSVARLPADKYFTVASVIGSKVWEGERFEVPPSILMHHANWVISVSEKLRLMRIVKRQMQSQR